MRPIDQANIISLAYITRSEDDLNEIKAPEVHSVIIVPNIFTPN